MIIGQIEGQDASPKDFRKFFSSNTWSSRGRDYYSKDPDALHSFYRLEPWEYDGETLYKSKFDPTNAPIPQEGDPVTGYRVFTYVEGDEDVLGSPTAGYMKSIDTMFGTPQRRDSINMYPVEGNGYYYFLGKEVAIAYFEHIVQMDETRKPLTTDAPLHVMVSRVEGSYVNKYAHEQDRGQYGEKMDMMKLVDTPILDINVTKLQEAYQNTVKTTIEHNPVWGDTRVSKGYRVFNKWDKRRDDYNLAFDLMGTGPEKLYFQEKHPASLLIESSLYKVLHKGEVSTGHYDFSKYKGLYSSDPEERYQAALLAYKDYQELRELFPGMDLPEEKPPTPPKTL